jgi:polyisoprenoid-binding protein YceI
MAAWDLRCRHQLALVLYSTVAVAASDTNLDTGKSSLIAIFRQENVPVEASFRRFSGKITFDPADVGAAIAALDVDTGSLDIGDDAYNAEIRKPSWFDTKSFPTATFRSKAITAMSADRLECVGILTIKGKSLTVKVPVGVKKALTGTAFAGTLDVSRKTFGIGSADWDDVLEDKVVIRFYILNNR